MVIWTDGKIRTFVDEMYDKPRGLCKWWIEQHKNEPRFNGGKLLIVSMTVKEQSKKICPNCNQPWNGIECNSCGFDANCFDQHWDLD
jgi:hypothetical protein